MFRYYVMFLNLVIFEIFKLYVKVHAMISKLSQVILLFLLCWMWVCEIHKSIPTQMLMECHIPRQTLAIYKVPMILRF